MRVVAVLFDVETILTEENIGADGTCPLQSMYDLTKKIASPSRNNTCIFFLC